MFLSLCRPLEGQLYKWTNPLKGWQPRWFNVDQQQGVLHYYTVSGCKSHHTHTHTQNDRLPEKKGGCHTASKYLCFIHHTSMGGVGLEQLSDLCLAHSSSPNKQSIHTLSVVLADNSPTLLTSFWLEENIPKTLLFFYS